MSILYKRFFMVAAMIAVLGVFTANLIQETRSQAGLETYNPINGLNCKTNTMCKLIKIKSGRQLS